MKDWGLRVITGIGVSMVLFDSILVSIFYRIYLGNINKVYKHIFIICRSVEQL